MTRARCYALAVLLGVCCLGQTRLVFAQTGPAAPVYPTPAPMFPVDNGYIPPEDPLAPVAQPPWYGGVDEVQAAAGRFGPLVVSSGFWIRAEYLNWNVQRPGNQLLGAPVAGVDDPTKPFIVFAPGTSTEIAAATVPTTQTMNLGNISGVRVTAGADLIYGGQVQVSAFMLARKQSGYVVHAGQSAPFDDDFDFTTDPFEKEEKETATILPVDIATSVLQNGQVSNHLLLYNSSFQAIFQSQVWGGEANYLFDQDIEGPLQCRPLVGFRYVNISERLTQRGVFQDTLLGGPPIVSTIDSLTMNNLYGAQIGLQTQIFAFNWLEVGVTPKLLFMGNTMLGSVFTNHLRSNSDGTVSSNDLTSTFSFGAEAQTWVQVKIAPRISARLGYDLLWFSRVTRPQSNIFYNDNGAAAPPGIVENMTFHTIFINGLSVGLQFTF